MSIRTLSVRAHEAFKTPNSMPDLLTAELDRLGGRTRLVDHEYYAALQKSACPGEHYNCTIHQPITAPSMDLQPQDMLWTPESVNLLPTVHPTITQDMQYIQNINYDFTGFDVGDLSNFSDVATSFSMATNLPDVQGMSNAFEFNLEQALGLNFGNGPFLRTKSASPAPQQTPHEAERSAAQQPSPPNGVSGRQPSPPTPAVAPMADTTWKVFVEQLGF